MGERTGVRTIRQCEGCEYPLADYMAEYDRGELTVEWYICEYHNHPHNNVPFDVYEDYDY